MRTLTAALLSLTVLAALALAQQADPAPVRFEAVDVYVDSGDEPLAAYQFELVDPTGASLIVGVEGGEHAAFADPPYYDPAALTQGRIVIAAFNTGDDLPTGRTRVARVHVQVTGEAAPDYAIELKVAGSRDGKAIQATATTAPGGER